MRNTRIVIFAVVAALAFSGDAFARSGGGFSSGGSKGFSSGGYSSSRSYSGGSSGGSRSYSSGGSSHSSSGSSGASKGFSSSPAPKVHASPPSAPTIHFDSAAKHAVDVDKSGRAFREAHPPAASPKSSSSTQARSPSSGSTSRTTSAQPRYTPQPRDTGGSTIVIDRSGNDNFWLWYWVLSQNQRDQWVYHHRNEVSKDDYDDLVRKDAQLEDRLRELETTGLARNPDFQVPAPAPVPVVHEGHHWIWRWILGILLLGSLYYLFFVHRFHPGQRRRTA